MGSSAPRTQTVTQQTTLPPWLESVTQENLRRADEISNRPYQPYTGQMTAGFTPEQEAAFAYTQQGIGATTPFYNAALGQAAADVGFQPLSVSPTGVGFQNVAPASVGAMNVGAGQTGFERVTGPVVQARDVTAGTTGFERVTGPAVQARDVTAQNFLSGNVGAYMNPFIENVENAALSRLQGATQQAVNRIGDQAAAARAFGGSRQGIAEGVALGEAARSAGELSANLRSQGFNQAAALMQADAQRALQADLANQQAGLAAGTTSAQLAQQAALANQAAGMRSGEFNVQQALQAALANQQAGLAAGTTSAQLAQQAGLANQAAGMRSGEFNVQQALQAALANQQANLAAGTTSANLAQQAALANQQAGLQAGQFNAQQALQAQQLNQAAGIQGLQARLAAGQQLGALAGQSQAAMQRDAALLENIGQQRQAMNQAALDEAYARFMEQRNFPIEMLNLRLGATSATPYGTTTTGQQLVPRGNAFLSGLGTVGSAASGIASLAGLFSDERAKTDIQKVGKDKESGLTMYAYRYKGDPKTYPKVVGPMAQEVEKKYPDQVRDVAGRKAVNLGFGPMRKAMGNG